MGLDGTPEVLLDPNTLSKDGTSALSGVDFSKDGKMLAYGISEKGSDWSVDKQQRGRAAAAAGWLQFFFFEKRIKKKDGKEGKEEGSASLPMITWGVGFCG